MHVATSKRQTDNYYVPSLRTIIDLRSLVLQIPKHCQWGMDWIQLAQDRDIRNIKRGTR
jgi:hypothetical protein